MQSTELSKKVLTSSQTGSSVLTNSNEEVAIETFDQQAEEKDDY